ACHVGRQFAGLLLDGRPQGQPGLQAVHRFNRKRQRSPGRAMGGRGGDWRDAAQRGHVQGPCLRKFRDWRASSGPVPQGSPRSNLFVRRAVSGRTDQSGQHQVASRVPRRRNDLRGPVSLVSLTVNVRSNEPRLTGAPAHRGMTIRLSNISKFYSGVPALRDVSAEFYEGEVHAILGENGAGKSTLINIISGALQPELGEIEFEGSRISSMSPELAASLGISISFQHPAVLDDLSVLENFQVALPPPLFVGKSAQTVARNALDAVGLRIPLRTRADALTVAQKHLLEVAKALAIKPKVLILDEPTASLDQAATDMLFDRIREVVRTGTSVIYITHRLAELRQIAQRVTVLRDGRVRGVRLVNEVSDVDLLSMIVGRALGLTFPHKSRNVSTDVNFAVESFSGKRLTDVSFEVSLAQIVGVAGVAGNGQSE